MAIRHCGCLKAQSETQLAFPPLLPQVRELAAASGVVPELALAAALAAALARGAAATRAAETWDWAAAAASNL